MARTKQTNSKIADKSNNRTKETKARPPSPNTSSSSSSSDEVDFFSHPHKQPDVQSESDSAEDSPVTESVAYIDEDHEHEEMSPPPLPQSSKTNSKPKGKAKAQLKQKSRKQEKPSKRIDRVDRDIRRLQDATNLLIPKAPFQRLVREIMLTCSDENMRVTGQALGALQASSEIYLTQLMEDSYLLTLHRHRVTMLPRDIQITMYIRNSHSRV